jgi:hypothetical protein
MAEQAVEGVLEAIVGTVSALGGLTAAAGAGTALFAFVLVILALEFLRESKGLLVPVARLAVVGALAFTGAFFLYGDFLSQPAKAALSRFTAGLPAASENSLLLTSLGVVGAGLTFYAGSKSGASAALRAAKAHAGKSGIRFVSRPESSPHFRVSDLGRGLSLDVAGRLHLRMLTRNPKKPPARALKPAMRTLAPPLRARG